jgi:hypothetical protein
MRLIAKIKASGRRGIATAAAVVLAAAGAVAIAVAVLSQQTVASPPPSAAGSVGHGSHHIPAAGSPSAAPSTSPSPTRKSVAKPASVTIPAISAKSHLIRLGKNSDGTLQVPKSYHVAGWYTGSARPGQVGPSVIVGHVDSYKGPGIFFKLGDLRPGNTVKVARADGSTAVFTVQGVKQYPKKQFPTYAVYHNIDYPGLRLITCGGTFDHSTGHYLSNIIAFAKLSKVIPAS